MDGAVSEQRGEHVVHATVLVEERKAVELGADEGHLKVISRPGSILDGKLRRAGEGSLEEHANGLGLHSGHGRYPGYAAEVRLVRALLFVKLGFWAGTITSALVVKRLFPSRGDADSDELALVAILDGIELESRSTAFRGGSLFSWFGGIALDLRGAKLAPDAHLTVHALWGGVAIRVPPGWRVECSARALLGGVTIDVPRGEDPNAPRLVIDGFALSGGIAVGAKPASS